jgi:hypothetical protein
MRLLIVAIAVLALACTAQASILLDFGEGPTVEGQPNPTYNPTPSPDPEQGLYWNNLWQDMIVGSSTFTNIIDSANNPTSIQVVVTGFTTDGDKGMDANDVYPWTAQRDAVGCKWLGDGGTTGIITISGLTEPEYAVRCFSSTHEDVSWYNDDTRRTDFTIGVDTRTVYCSGNTSYTETFYNIAPSSGVITLYVDGATPGGTATYSYGYCNVVELIIPEPATLSLLALGGLAAIRRRRR